MPSDPITEAQQISAEMTSNNLNITEYAADHGMSRSAVSHKLRLLDLPAPVQLMLSNGQLQEGHGRVLLRAPKSEQNKLAQMAIRRKMSVRALENILQASKGTTVDEVENDINIKMLEQDLTEHYGSQVHIEHDKKGKGKMIIWYHSLDILEGILAKGPFKAK